MCGIAGYAGKGDKNSLEKMLEATSHRGPDSRGTFVDGNIGLGANRLSIIDLSPFGKQPMFDQDKSLSIVFNGEIYNFHDLRKQLVRKYRFQSKTDTEVVLYAYKEWGVDCLRKLNGMFSFVIYDRTKQLLFGARDRLGEKPLKYYVDRGNFAFASEVKGLLPIVSKIEIDPIAIHHYLTLQYVPAPFTGFQKIFKLPPAHYFLYKDGKLQIKRYWEFFFAEKLSLAEKEWEELLLAKLIESVKSRLMADVPFGVFLSGGIDSSCVVALMALFSKRPIKTFTISFDEASFNEAQYANIVARQYRTNHKVLQVTQKMMGDLFTHLADYYDEPFAD
jgi:asparagine synthase (glutamine-hydrolysing)